MYGTDPDTAFYFYFTQYLIPGIFSFLGELFYVIFAQFVHISSSLLKADKRRGDNVHSPAPFAGFESDDRSGMVGHLFRYVLLQISVFYRSLIGERFVELDDKVVLEVFRNTTLLRVV